MEYALLINENTFSSVSSSNSAYASSSSVSIPFMDKPASSNKVEDCSSKKPFTKTSSWHFKLSILNASTSTLASCCVKVLFVIRAVRVYFQSSTRVVGKSIAFKACFASFRMDLRLSGCFQPSVNCTTLF